MNGSALSPLTDFEIKFSLNASPFMDGLAAVRASLGGPRTLAFKVAGFYAALQRPESKRAPRPRNHRPHRRPNRARRLRGR